MEKAWSSIDPVCITSDTHRPGDDEVVRGVAAAHHVIRVLVGDVLGGQADLVCKIFNISFTYLVFFYLGVSRGQGVSHLVPGDHPKRVVGPRRHRYLEGGGRGGDKV